MKTEPSEEQQHVVINTNKYKFEIFVSNEVSYPFMKGPFLCCISITGIHNIPVTMEELYII